MNLTSIAVLGCGWLGLPLARALAQAGHRVAGSTTTPDKLPQLAAAGITPHLIRLGPETSAADLLPLLAGAAVLVVSVPPSRAAADRHAYAAALRPVADALTTAGTVQSVLFSSSTGVYPDEPRAMQEADAIATADAENHLLRAEALFQQPCQPWQTTVLRLGGLMGPGRAPGRFLAGRIDLPQPTAPVNMLHLADAVGVSQAIIQQGIWGRTLNVCAAGHPSRQQFYQAAAAQLGLPAPQFVVDGKSGKQISTAALRTAVAYDFRYDDPLKALPYC